MATAPPRESRAEGRVPPHDLDAEQSVLGAILQDPEAIARILDFLDPEDFYRENHAQVYRACIRLFQDGEPIDNVTVTDALDKAGVLERVGGRAGLLLLQETVPTAANIDYYARIVKERSYKRRLIHAGGTVAQLGYDPAVEAEDALSQAQAAVYNIAEDRIKQDFERLYDLLRPAMDRIDAQMASGKGVVGIPSGFTDVDRLTSGFKPGELVIVAGRPGIGKALALDTPIPTPDGWKTMGSLRVGDQVFDDQGNPCTVTRATDVMYGRRCYEVVFSDGEVIVADAEHLWATSDRVSALFAVRTTDQLRSGMSEAGGAARYAIERCSNLAPVEVSAPQLVTVAAGRPGVNADPAGPHVIEEIRPVASVPVRCIQVDSPSHLYLAGHGCIPTHNTSWCLNVILEIATEHKVPVAMFSLEMSKDQLVERLLCEHARIDAQRMHRGQLSDAEYDRLAQSLGPLSEAPIFIDDAPTLDELTVLLKSRQIHLREKVGMIIIDYLQLMHGRSRGDDANRVQEVSAISRSLKMVARELGVPVIAISQLSRAVEQRTDKRPMLSDLRESGSIEQDSDQVIFLYRDDYYKDDVRPGIAEVILAKNRNGPTGKAELKFVKEQTRFYNLEARRPEPAQ